MMLLLISKHRKKIAFVLVIIFYLDFITPVMAAANTPMPRRLYAWEIKNYYTPRVSQQLQNDEPVKEIPETPVRKAPYIDGPGQPEMKSFQSVNSNDMVDLFTGDFSYKVDLLDVGGYPINLHYSSGITMDQEASWVGLGWNINPGTISRSMRGLPDDFDGVSDSITKTQHVKENKTIGVTIEPGLEIVGAPINVSARLGIFYNSYNGYGLETGVGIGGTGKTSFGSLTGNLSISNNSQEGIRISPSLSANLGKQDAENHLQGSLGISTGYSSRGGISAIQINGGIKSNQQTYKGTLVNSGVNYPLASISFASHSYTPSITMPMRTVAYSFTGKLGGEIWGTDASVAFTGYVNKQDIDPQDNIQKMPALGYLYATNGNGRENVLMDFNRQNDGEFNYKSTPLIAVPQYTYDAFSISGEGIGGSFRPYRGDVGYIFDHALNTRSSSTNGSIDVGLGTAAHVGLEITNITTTNANHRWNQSNNIESKLRFQKPDTTYEAVYFRNPGEKTTNAKNYYQSIGDESLIRVKLAGSKDNVRAESAFVKYDKEGHSQGEIPVSEALVKKQRDKRTQVISYLNAQDASLFGLDKLIRSYKRNTVPLGQCQDTFVETPRVYKLRKKNHLSEISALNSDGKKYVYGLPIYNEEQKDVTFAINKDSDTSNTNRGLTGYIPNVDNTPSNSKGKDGYFSREEMPAYAHNFLLTGILTPDYVDITGNGISDDDPGDAIKFNYTQVYGGNDDYYDWRTPFDFGKANYNEGFKTYNRDDKASYIYGRKEMWYLNSIESKTMIAVFYISNNRHDSYAVLGENGGLNTSKATYRLDSINLFVKADLVKNGVAKTRPVKSVFFEYTEELCKGNLGNTSLGKLTLKKVSFTYNRNPKGKLNPFIFNYHPGSNGQIDPVHNPSYNAGKSDRWGIYKDPADNPMQMRNSDYPYAIQDSGKAARNAGAWALTDIQIPAGGKLHIIYEADDYAYVQDKRATQMFTIAGIEQPDGNNLYNQSSKTDFYKIYINSTDALRRKSDVKNKYLGIDNVLYFKLAVTMPTDEFGSGTEFVPGYATVADYGITPGNDHQFWIRVAQVEGRSPWSRAALQYLRLNLRSKAYPGSEGVENIGLKEVIKMMATSISELKNMILGFDDAAKTKGICNTVDLTRSFVRLSSPSYKKYGGGHRVKRIEIFDNWNHMTTQKESIYGQEYIYKTAEEVDGKMTMISSGVATYEPGIGGEENPFRRPINYVETTAPMGPVNYMFSEEPVGEAYFPSPMVGYSKVRVRTINAKARSANGWTESTFYTSRDFPTIVSHTLLEENVSRYKYETSSNILRLNHKNYATLSQGFLIELNDMNGKAKGSAVYSEKDSLQPISYNINFYKVDDEKTLKKHLNNQVWAVDSVSGHIDTFTTIGKDIEIMADLREQRSIANTVGFSPNVDIISPFLVFIPVLVLPSKVNLPQKEDTRFRSAAIVKVVQRYGIMDSIVVMNRGNIVSTKNILFDAETGNVILSRTNNDFNDPVYKINYPAYWAYSGMGLAYKNLGAVFQRKETGDVFQINKGRLFKQGSTDAYPANRHFESGDEVYVYDANLAVPGSDCRFLLGTTAPWKGKLWVLDAAKGIDNDKGLYFIDSAGKVAPDMVINKMVIMRSGKRNMLDLGATEAVMLGNPLKLMPDGNYRIVIDSTTKVLDASATTFKDNWKVDNSEYQADSCYVLLKQEFGKQLSPDAPATIFRDSYIHKRHDPPIVGNIVGSHFVASSFKRNIGGNNNHIRYNLKSVLQFKQHLADSIPQGATLSNAILILKAQAPRTAWSGVGDSRLDGFTTKTKAHYFNGSGFHNTDNSGNIRRVVGPWILGTGYNNLATGSSSVFVSAAPDQSCIDKDINITTLVTQMRANPASDYGIVFDLNAQTTGNTEDNSSERTQSFCARLIDVHQQSSTPCIGCITAKLAVDYSYYKDTCVKVCRKNITDTANPYRWGILGNWRNDKSYVYYNTRLENDATIKTTNIRVEGTLKSFIPFWSFTSNGITPSADTVRWVWSVTNSLYQRRGMQTETYDVLYRYNAGIFGYSQTMPIAVAQNSRYREMLFDGFEDYGFRSTTCNNCLPKREYDFVKGNIGVDTTTVQSHTGLYSLLVTSGHESLLTVPVLKDTLTRDPKLSTILDSSEVVTVPQVTGSGLGLAGSYTMGRRRIGNLCLPSGSTSSRTDTTINFNWTSAPPFTPGGLQPCDGAYRVTWTGTIQPRYTDQYLFYLTYNGTASIMIDGNFIYSNTVNQVGEGTSVSIFLQAGSLHSVTISYTKTMNVNPGPVELRWSSFVNQAKEIIPKKFLYPVIPAAADTTGSVTPVIQYYCVKAKPVKTLNVLRETFSPIAKSKVSISAWVRLDVANCNATPSLDSVIQVQFSGGFAGTWLKKTGTRIEGWQRYEAILDMPPVAVSMFLRLKTLTANNIFIDDIRVQPFNSVMKSYVFNPTNLRMIAELDENNYASFYEYDDEGTLIRQKKETERGIVTLQETRSANVKE